MTDTVNVPREAVEEFRKWYEMDRGRAILKGKARKIVARILLASAPKAEPVSGDWYSAEIIDALVREIDIALNGENAAPQAKLCDLVKQIKELARPEAPKVEQEPVAYVSRKGFTIGGLVWTNAGIATDLPDETKLYTRPAPAIDELLEAVGRLIDRAEEVRNMLAAHPAMQGREHVSMGVAFNNAIGRAQSAYAANHKEAQS